LVDNDIIFSNERVDCSNAEGCDELVEVSPELKHDVAYIKRLVIRLAHLQADQFAKLAQGQDEVKRAICEVKDCIVSAPAPPEDEKFFSEADMSVAAHSDDRNTCAQEAVCLAPQSITSPRPRCQSSDVKRLSNMVSKKTRFARQKSERMLQRLLFVSDTWEKTEAAKRQLGRWHCFSKDQIETVTDSFIGVVICMHAIVIGLSMDFAGDNPDVFIVLDAIFTTVFIAEISAKLFLNGLSSHFCGGSAVSNCFDAIIVLIDFIQLAVAIFFPDDANNVNAIGTTSLLRMLRLVKLTRIIRLMRAELFKDLLAMIRGLIGGATVLGWSIVFFIFVVYVVALLLRESLGRHEDSSTSIYFANVPRAMYTTFRCSFGDCTTINGTPIFEEVQVQFGTGYSLFYCLFIFTVTIGLFNVISAIFVESTIAARVACENNKLRQRIEDEELWARKATTLIRRLILHSEHAKEILKLEETQPLSDTVGILGHFEVDNTALDSFLDDPITVATLAELDIDPEDNARFVDIFDPDNGGTIAVHDLIEGLNRLRGKPRRSDIVTVELMIRSIQLQIADMCALLPNIVHVLGLAPESQRSSFCVTQE